MNKYFAIFKYSLKSQLTFFADYIFSLISFSIHVFVFNELWDFILKEDSIVGYTRSELIWYIIIAECIIYSSIATYRKIGDMVKQGDIANMLTKPVDVINYFLAENLSVIIKFIVNIIWAIILGFCFAGPISVSFTCIIFTVLAGIIGVFIGCLMQIFCGIIGFFTEEILSFWLIFQKLSLFIVFTPLEFYPVIIQKILYFLPTTQGIYVAAKIFTKYSLSLAMKLIMIEIISAVGLYVIIRIMYNKGVKQININGG